MFKYLIIEITSAIIGFIAFAVIIRYLWKQGHFHTVFKQKWLYAPIVLLVIAFLAGFIANKTYPPDFAMPAFMHSHAPGGLPPSIPFAKIFDIGANPNSVPKKPQASDADGIVRISLTAQEVISEISPGIYFNYWTYNKQVPGPMLRVREGDKVELALTNDPSSLHD